MNFFPVRQRLFESANVSQYTKDAFHRYVIDGETQAVNPLKKGTKTAAHYVLALPAGGQYVIRCRLSALDDEISDPFDASHDRLFARRRAEAEVFYKTVIPGV